VTFISSFATPGISNLAVTYCAKKCRFQNSAWTSASIASDSYPRAVRGILEFHTTQKVGRIISPSHGWARRTHIDRCLLRGGAGEGTRAAGCVDGSKGKPLSGECTIGGDLPLSSDLIFEGEAAISRSLALRTALHTRSSDSASSGVAGPDELVDA
jgi:hypothetical protein